MATSHIIIDNVTGTRQQWHLYHLHLRIENNKNISYLSFMTKNMTKYADGLIPHLEFIWSKG